MKKKLAILTGALSLTFVVLTGCGKTPSAEEILDGMYEAEIESANFELSADVDVEAGDYAFEAGADLSGAFSEDAYYVDGKVSYNVMGQKDSMDVEAYMLMDGSDVTAYYNTDGTWYVTETSTDDAGVSLDDKTIEKMQDAAKELFAGAKVEKKTEEVGDEECYVLTVEPSGEEYVAFMNEVVKIADAEDEWEEACETMEDELDVKMEDVLDLINLKATLYVSKENGYAVKSEVDLSGIDVAGIIGLSSDIEDALDDMDMSADDIKINALSVVVEYSDINDAEVEVPDDVVEDAVDPYAWYDYDFDDYDTDVDVDVDTDVDTVVDVVADDSEWYSEEDGWFTLADYWTDGDVYEREFDIPDLSASDIAFYDAYSPYYYAFQDDGYTCDVLISSDMTVGTYYIDKPNGTSDTYDLFNYINYGELPDEGTYYNYSVVEEDLTEYGYDRGKAYTFFMEDDDYYYYDVYIVVEEYEDNYGDQNGVVISFSDRIECDDYNDDYEGYWFYLDYVNGEDDSEGVDWYTVDDTDFYTVLETFLMD